MALIFHGLLLASMMFCIRWLYAFEPGRKKRAALAGLIGLEWLGGFCTGWLAAGCAAVLLTALLFVLFYGDGECPKPAFFIGMAAIWAAGGLALWVGGLAWPDGPWLALLTVWAIAAQYLLVLGLRGQLRAPAARFLPLLALGFGGLAATGQGVAAALLLALTVLALEFAYRGYAHTFQESTAEFQNRVLSHHYEEVKNVYLNMRGWRHDYHNHIQTMKAQLHMGRVGELERYLNELEDDLNQVDTLIHSGNLLVDAILNSKLSLAKARDIRLDCTATVPEALSVSDTDLCVIVGNLMDNAIEACEKVEPEQRFLRLYMAVMKRQLYLSVTNSAPEEADFNARHYITEKRGNHGHGVKRVKLTVDKYDGYLNLKNEPGVFVSEVMLPMKE
ncbi:MAG: GHKL domain-containing protein [Clostridia bacterium]|nr:GHKL domain-containing protein [Clostridia bacterium]